MTLLIPFAAYPIAERFRALGHSAAVAAGMMMNYTTLATSGSVSSRLRAKQSRG